MEDVVVIGGGVVGLSIALELAGQGAAVAVLDQADFGREASWAGAGILPPGNLEAAETPESQLRSLSHALWQDWAASLQSETGIDTGYVRCGGLEVRTAQPGEDFLDEVRFWRREGVRVDELSPTALREAIPEISPTISAAYRLPALGQVRNPRLLKALIAACSARGVRLCAGTSVIGFDTEPGHVIGMRTAAGIIRAGRYCVAGGPWSRGLFASVGIDLPVEPVRGQIVLLSHIPRIFSQVIQVGPRYVVPRNDGRILIGATEECVGFLKANTASAVSGLIEFATSLVPRLADATLERAWSGLRPRSADGLPYLGRLADYDNLFAATGHFRSGLQMSPGTARLLRQALLDQETDISLDPFTPDRRLKQTRNPQREALKQATGLTREAANEKL